MDAVSYTTMVLLLRFLYSAVCEWSILSVRLLGFLGRMDGVTHGLAFRAGGSGPRARDHTACSFLPV